MDENQQAEQRARQEQQILDIRKELEPICEKHGYSLGQVCYKLKADEYAKDSASMGWDGLGTPPNWFLKETQLTEEEHWALRPAQRLEKLRGFHKKTN